MLRIVGILAIFLVGACAPTVVQVDGYEVVKEENSLIVKVPSLNIKPKSEIQAGDRAGLGLIHGLLNS